ncbi:MAG: hypothetical protein MR658_08535, partial [Campylobacter sp.]|uniref:hypothetical protein n=1 Tax=Campylobacter sp. TaxID=205 RepID=UPI002AA793DF
LKEYKATGTGSDVITISGASTVAVNKIDTGAGNDTVNVNASGSITGTLDTGNGDDTVVVSGASSSISGATINLGAGNDKITLATVGDNGLKGATIDGGAGRDTLIVSGDISGSGDFTLKNIEVLQANTSAKLSYAQIAGQELTLTSGTGNKLEIKADNETVIDLTKLNTKVATGEKALTTIELINVGSGATVTLNKDDGIAETIKLAAQANKVTITGIASGDKINVKDIAAFNDKKGTDATFTKATTASKVTLNDDKNAYIDLSTKNLDKITENDLTAYISNSNNKKALIAVEGSDGIKFFSAVGGGASVTFTELNVTLLGVTGDNVDNTTLSLA